MDVLSLYGISRVFILGAGFSAPMGMPLTYEILRLAHTVAKGKPWFGDGGVRIPYGQAAWLLDELQWYFPQSNISHDSIQNGVLPKGFDIERFLSYIAATSAFQYHTGERWDEHGDKFTAFLKCWLAEAIYDRQQLRYPALPDFYRRFASHLDGSLILTFNWDTVLETLFDQLKVPYKFDLPSTYKNRELPLIKLHGSIDWFTRPQMKHRDPWMQFKSISGGFRRVGRGQGDLRRFYGTGFNTPWIVMPSYDKISQILMMGEMWQLPWMFLQDQLEVVIIGFSMRPDDFHSRAFVYPQLVDGSERGLLQVKVIDHAKTPAQKAAIRGRFQGVKNCRFFFDGFSDGALDFLQFP